MSDPRPRLSPLPTSSVRQPPDRVLALPLAVSAALCAVSLALVWHHRFDVTVGYTLVYGIDGESWMIAMAAVPALFAIRYLVRPSGGYARLLVSFAAFLGLVGIYADYLDTQNRAAQFGVVPYFGAGFYAGLAGAVTLLAGAVVCWIRR